MGAGLDELIESLLTEIAFSGVRGCSVLNLLSAIDSFYGSSSARDEYDGARIGRENSTRDSAEKPQQPGHGHDLAVASKIWAWLANRSDVSIGSNRAFNHLSLDQVLALPEEEDPPSSGVAVKSSIAPSTNTRAPPHPRPGARMSKDETATVRPRLHVSEERQWRTIAGHGPDLKRIPLFEWRALVDIASVKEKGILQGDLVRLTGQDKRSLPTRTDALARKGYVIKQPIVLRGGKSSKLWLAQFSEYAKEHQEREGLDYESIDLSRAALTSDLHPVPFCGKWNGETIDYLALAQAFVAIVKAWALIRYCDARAKLGVEERVRQMRALAKTCRWLTNIGALSFVGAKFAGSNRLFKDCVKYIRDPSPAEWSHFRATPKTRMVVPSGRIGKRGEASRAVHASQVAGYRSKPPGKKRQSTKSRSDPVSHASIIPMPWNPQKPVPNTAFEIIKRAGPKGTSNAAICRQTLGHNYRRLTAAMTGSISMPTNSQPLHLKHLSSTSQLSRIGKTMTYTFYANSELADVGPTGHRTDAPATISGGAASAKLADTATSQNDCVFPPPDTTRFPVNPDSTLTEIGRAQQQNRTLSRKSKRKRPVDEELDGQPPTRLPRRLGCLPARVAVDEPMSGSVDERSRSELGDPPALEQQQQSETCQPVPREPGVYRGAPNSLDPVIKRKGRRRRSLVIIFRSDRLKDPSFLGVLPSTPEVDGADISGREVTTEATPRRLSAHIQDANSTDTPCITSTTPRVTSERSQSQSKAPKLGKNNSFRCDKCGNSWKNSNGLDYHLTKSRTACNPDFVPASSELLTSRKRKNVQPQVLEYSTASRLVSEDQKHSRPNLTPKAQVESRVERKKQPVSPRPQNQPPDMASPSEGFATHTPPVRGTPQYQGSIILKDLEVYDATDHRRILRQGTLRTSKDTSANKGVISTADSQQFSIHASSSLNTTINGPIHHMNAQGRHGDDPPKSLPHTDAEQMESLVDSRGLADATNTTISGQDIIPGSDPYIPVSVERPGYRTPLPSIPPNKIAHSSHAEPMITAQPDDIQAARTIVQTFDIPTTHLYPPPTHTSGQHPAHKSLDSFARPTRPNASFGARRRARTIQIIEYLLEHNDGVFPGLRSLFMAVISVWAKEFRDLAPPDRRICQNTVNQMERDGILKQMHFFFFDDQAKMQECVVLAKADNKNSPAVDSSDDPRVIAVKEKMREMFPEAYVPNAFCLSPDEAKLFDELASQGKEHNQTRSLRMPKDLKKVQDIETLHYENSVMGDIAIHRTNAKRQADDIQVDPQPPPKRSRVDVEQSDLTEKTRKSRRRPDKHELWDSGKLAVYIWSQRQRPSAMWEQHRSCLQDPTTGTWSWTPETDPSQPGNITTILSSVKSARHIDASLKRKGRRGWAGDRNGRGNNNNNRYNDYSKGQLLITADDLVIADGDEGNDFDSAVINPPASVSFSGALLPPDEDSEDLYEDSSEAPDDENAHPDTSEPPLASRDFPDDSNRSQPWDSRRFITKIRHPVDSTEIGSTPRIPRFSLAAWPRDVQDILSTVPRVHSFRNWDDPAYGMFLWNLKIIGRWERSADGVRMLTRGTAAPEPVYISLSPDATKANMKSTNLEWLGSNQLTADNIPEEVKNASAADEEYGLSYLKADNRKVGEVKERLRRKMIRNRTANVRGLEPKVTSQELGRGLDTMPQSATSPTEPEGFIEYKTRDLTIIPKQPRGRFNKPAAHDDKLGSKREDELVAACVVFRTLLGGLDRNLDIGLLLKHFPGMSLSAIKKFWPRISRERKSYVQALTAKFQSAFLRAYENGELPPLDYDDVDNYDWPMLISWATQLETHEDVNLPESREMLHRTHTVGDVTNEIVDWRETWFATTSTYNRIEAVASETMSIPLPPRDRQDRMMLERARTWVRSICCTPLKGVNVRDTLIPKLLELGNGDAAETNRILEKAVTELNREKVITRTKGKDLGGNFRIHGTFSKQLDKMAGTPKFRQAIAFKSQLDEIFRHSQEHIMPYASDDGSIMAVLNLQAHGRIRIDTIGMPDIPFGFEPGNYEGRTFPKSYYHFKVRLAPTETYLFNDDMALLEQAKRLEPPTRGPGEKIPIWVDFFGKVNAARWADYVSMIVFTLAIKGPIKHNMCVTLLKPMIDEFEVELIINWLDQFGLIQQAVNGCGVTVAEWWWLVVGHIVQASDRATGKSRVIQVDP